MDLHLLRIFKKKVDANILRKKIPPIEGLKKEWDLQWKIKKPKKI